MKKILYLTAAVFLIFSCMVYADTKEKENGEQNACPALLGNAPQFSLKDIEGKEIKLSDFKDQGVILFFWASWCPRCREEIPGLNRVYVLLKKKGINFLSIDAGETEKRIRRFVKNIPIDFPVLLDASQKVSQSYVVVGIPTFVVVNKNGQITFQNHFWPHNYEELLSCR